MTYKQTTASVFFRYMLTFSEKHWPNQYKITQILNLYPLKWHPQHYDPAMNSVIKLKLKLKLCMY